MRIARLVTVFVVGLALTLTPLHARAAETTIAMRNLNNPRGLALGPNGSLYVAEAGRGGPQACFVGPEGQVTAGRTGSISRLWRGAQERIVTGLASHAAPDGTGATGPHDLHLIGNGQFDVTIGLGNDPAARSACLPIGAEFGWIARAKANGDWRLVTDLAAYEARANPDGGIRDSNPYGLLTDRPDGPLVATDAGGNTLLAISRQGAVETLAVFPSRSTGRGTDSVPTAVTRGPDGALYVGELTGFPFAPGSANVYRVVPGSAPTVFRSGFTMIIDIAFGSDGSLYVLEFGPGVLKRVTPGGAESVVASGFVAPTSVAIGRDGAFYVSNCGVFPAGDRADDPPPCRAGGGGHVLRITE